MKTLLFFFLLFVVIFSGCEKIIPDLPRDNPLDTANLSGNVKKELKFASYEVTCKYASGAVNYTTENTVKAGDRIFLWINVKNTGGAKLSGIRASITSSSNLIQITPLTGSMFIRFTEGSDMNDFINAGSTGHGVITNGQSFMFADNYNSYAIQFKVSSSAVTGNLIPFNLTLSDNSGDQWSETFNVTVN